MMFIEELKRRKVFRVAAAYLVAAWIIIQAADILLENYGAPGWVFQALGVLLLLGFPLACVLAWAFDVVPATDEGSAAPAQVGRERWIIPVLVVLVVVLLADRLLLTGEAGSVPSEEMVSGKTAADTERSIAVLPFENFSSSEEHAYFSDGLADTILHRLAQIEELTVIARNSSFAYKGQNVDVRRIGEELNVGAVLEGSVQRQGSNLRVIAQLVETENGSHLWSKTFDRKMQDVFAIQDEIAVSVAEALSVTMLGETIEALSQSGTSNARALELMMQLQQMEQSSDVVSSADLEAMLPLAREAIRLDPGFVDAWVSLAHLHLSRAFRSRTSETYRDALEEARIAIQRAMVLDPASTGVRTVFAEYLRRSGEPQQALTVALTVIEDEPNNVGAMSLVALSYMANDRDAEALVYLQRAYRLDPFDPFLLRQLASAYRGLGDIEKAEKFLLQGIDKYPDMELYYGDLSYTQRIRGDWLGSLPWVIERDGSTVTRSTCRVMLRLHRFDLFNQNNCLRFDGAGSLTLEMLYEKGEFREARRLFIEATAELPEEPWRSGFTQNCILAEDAACALMHARAGFDYHLDDFNTADFRDRDITRALTIHALAEWKWGDNRSLAESIFRQALAIVQKAPMVAFTRNCTLCGRAFTEAELLAVLGETAAALDALEASLPADESRVFLTGLMSDIPVSLSPFFDNIREEPRFIAVMNEVDRRRGQLGEKLEDVLKLDIE